MNKSTIIPTFLSKTYRKALTIIFLFTLYKKNIIFVDPLNQYEEFLYKTKKIKTLRGHFFFKRIPKIEWPSYWNFIYPNRYGYISDFLPKLMRKQFSLLYKYIPFDITPKLKKRFLYDKIHNTTMGELCVFLTFHSDSEACQIVLNEAKNSRIPIILGKNIFIKPDKVPADFIYYTTTSTFSVETFMLKSIFKYLKIINV